MGADKGLIFRNGNFGGKQGEVGGEPENKGGND